MARRMLSVHAALLLLLVWLVVTGCATSSNYTAWKIYGEALPGHDTPVSLGVLSFDEVGPVLVEGEIGEVCAMMGCWLTVLDGDQEARVTMKDHAFFVPMNAAGRRIVIKGFGRKKILTVDELQHIAQDAGKTDQEIDAITEPVEVYEIEATSVYIEGNKLDAPYVAEQEEGAMDH